MLLLWLFFIVVIVVAVVSAVVSLKRLGLGTVVVVVVVVAFAVIIVVVIVVAVVVFVLVAFLVVFVCLFVCLFFKSLINLLQITLQRLAAQVCGLFVDVEEKNFERRIATVLPIVASVIAPDQFEPVI